MAKLKKLPGLCLETSLLGQTVSVPYNIIFEGFLPLKRCTSCSSIRSITISTHENCKSDTRKHAIFMQQTEVSGNHCFFEILSFRISEVVFLFELTAYGKHIISQSSKFPFLKSQTQYFSQMLIKILLAKNKISQKYHM